jgi:hypothetical protein
MMQDMQQSQYFLLIGSAMLDLPKVVDDHVANFFGAILLRQQVLSERGRSDSGRCSCSAIASTSSSVKPQNPTQSSSVTMLHDATLAQLAELSIIGVDVDQ